MQGKCQGPEVVRAFSCRWNKSELSIGIGRQLIGNLDPLWIVWVGGFGGLTGFAVERWRCNRAHSFGTRAWVAPSFGLRQTLRHGTIQRVQLPISPHAHSRCTLLLLPALAQFTSPLASEES